MEDKTWSDEDMIAFGNWYRMWYSHPQVGTHAYDALKKYKELIKEENKIETK